MSIDRTNFNALVDDDGTGTKGTIWNKTQIQSVLLDPIDLACAHEVIQNSVGGTPTSSLQLSMHYLQMTNTSAVGMHGFHAPANDGDFLIVVATGAAIYLYHESASAANVTDRLNNYITSSSAYGTVITAPTGNAMYIRSGGRWRMIAHTQGAPLASTLNLKFGGANVGMTYSGQAINFSVQGTRVFIDGRITLSAKGTSTGSATIDGLPYAPAVLTAMNFGYFMPVNGLYLMSGYISGSSIYLNGSGSNTGSGGLTDAHFLNNTDLMFTFTYPTS